MTARTTIRTRGKNKTAAATLSALCQARLIDDWHYGPAWVVEASDDEQDLEHTFAVTHDGTTYRLPTWREVDGWLADTFPELATATFGDPWIGWRGYVLTYRDGRVVRQVSPLETVTEQGEPIPNKANQSRMTLARFRDQLRAELVDAQAQAVTTEAGEAYRDILNRLERLAS